MFDLINAFFQRQAIVLVPAQPRKVVVFHADDNHESLSEFIENLQYDRKLVVSAFLNNAIAPEKTKTKLGEEYDLVVFDVRESFNPDALGVVAGVLCGGGCLLIILPTEKIWQKNTSLFYKHFYDLLSEQQGVYYFSSTGMSVGALTSQTDNSISVTGGPAEPYKTRDQQLAVELISNLLKENSQCCCVLTSGRGRGKSSALGIIAAGLLQNESQSVLITAPRLSVADVTFKHLHQQCPQGESGRGEFTYKYSRLKFIAPDLLLEKQPAADVLFIDEAAAIPVSMLAQLLTRYSKIIFSTTTHGYEGTGRGFILKFYQLLNKQRPGWHEIKLHQPVRWAVHDSLEKWIESLLFLNLKLTDNMSVEKSVEDCSVELINREQLLNDKETLAAIFSLLVSAHYRTSPADFKYLLDSENIRIYVLWNKKILIGVLVVNQEGGFDRALSTAIYRGERRPQGNLLAQTLCFHGGDEFAASLCYARIMRIAIHPQCQQAGFGSFLLQQVIKAEQLQGVDAIGSSFAATQPLLNFWYKAGLSLVRFGFSRDHVTASHSAVMAKGLSENGCRAINQLEHKFGINIEYWLSGPLAGLPDDIKNSLSARACAEPIDTLSPYDLADIESFARYNRNYDTCMPAIVRFVNSFTLLPAGLSESDRHILQLSVKYLNDWKQIVANSDATGKNQAVMCLRSALKQLFFLADKG